jgi:hypothetical protein
MAPLRRYLRITKHSVLEVRIYLDRPADADAWLLKRDDPALPHVIQAVRPLVLPKLREENERGKGRGGAKAKKKGVKDVVIEGQFIQNMPTKDALLSCATHERAVLMRKHYALSAQTANVIQRILKSQYS